MMDDIIQAMDAFIRQSTETYKKWPYANKAKIKNWRVCAALVEDGWAFVAGETPEDDVNGITLTWRKEGREDRKVTLSFTEQQLWLRYLELKNKAKEKRK